VYHCTLKYALCGSMVDIQSPTAEIRREKKKEKKKETEMGGGPTMFGVDVLT